MEKGKRPLEANRNSLLKNMQFEFQKIKKYEFKVFVAIQIELPQRHFYNVNPKPVIKETLYFFASIIEKTF